MSYEVMNNAHYKSSGLPILRIGGRLASRGGIYLNGIAIGLLGPSVEVLWDEGRKKVAFRSALNGAPGAKCFSIGTSSSPTAFSCARLRSKIPAMAARESFVGRWNEEQKLLEFCVESLFGMSSCEVAK